MELSGSSKRMQIRRVMRIPPSAADETLAVKRMRAGDAEAFSRIYRTNQAALYRFAYQMSGDERLAEEVVHDVFLALLRSDVLFDATRGTLQNFLFGVTRNHVRRRLFAGHEVAFDDLDEEQYETAGDCDTLGDLTRRETIESVRQAILALPANYRETVVLCELQEMSYEDAAKAIGCAVGTVRSRLHRGRALLVEKLKVTLRCMA